MGPSVPFHHLAPSRLAFPVVTMPHPFPVIPCGLGRLSVPYDDGPHRPPPQAGQDAIAFCVTPLGAPATAVRLVVNGQKSRLIGPPAAAGWVVGTGGPAGCLPSTLNPIPLTLHPKPGWACPELYWGALFSV